MENNLMVFKNNELNIDVRTMKNEDGSILINAKDMAIGFGWVDNSKFAKSGERYVRWNRVNKYVKEVGFPQQLGEYDYISESLFYLLAMKAYNDVAKKFQKWLAVEVIPLIRKTGSYQSQQKALEVFNDTLDSLQQTISENKETIEEYKNMCKINSSKKRNYTDYIKKRLGINKSNSEYEQVKARVFFILNINKWEDISLDTSKNILNIIDESIGIVKKERPYEQLSYFD